MKKFLLMMMLCVMSVVGAWAQATHSVYKFISASDGTLFMDAEGQTAASYNANDVCSGTYYLKVDYQHTTAPATKNGPSTFNVKTYYVDGVCTYGQTYDADGAYKSIATITEITDANKAEYVGTVGRFNESAATGVQTTVYKTYEWGSQWEGTGVCVNAGDICDDDTHYYISSGAVTGSDLKSASYSWTGFVSVVTGFTSTEGIYTLSDGIYTKIPTTAYDESETYYVVTFDDADPSDVAADANFETSKLYDLSGVTEPIYHKNGTSYDIVVDGEPFIDDDEYYVAGISYQPCTPAELAALGYTTGTTTTYNCSVVESADKKTITITRNTDWSLETMEAYIAVASDVLSNHENVVIEDATDAIGKQTNLNGLITCFNQLSNVTNVVLSDCLANNAVAYDLSSLNSSCIKRIILPNANRTNFKDITISESCPVLLEAVNKYNGVCYVHSSKEGYLDAIKDSHYYSDDINNSKWIEIDGPVNAEDIKFMNGIKNDHLNLAGLICAVNEEEADLRAAMHNFTNDEVKYLVWPVFTTEPSNPLYTDLYNQCNKLVAVGQYVQMGYDHMESQGQSFDVKYGKLIANTTEPGKIKEITDMLAEYTKAANNYTANTAIKYIKISGSLNAADLYKFDDAHGKIGKDGHLYFTEPVDEYASTDQGNRKNADDPNGESTIEGALNGCGGIVSIDLSDAVFERYEDMSLNNLNLLGSSTKEVKIPTSPLMKDLPADFLNASTAIEEICIPSNIQNIHARAFYGLSLKHVWTTGTDPNVKYDNGATYEVGEEESKTLESYNYGDEIPAGAKMVYGTYTFSPNLKFIGSGTFAGSTNIHDVYMLGTQAPVCCVDAFSTISYVANNSYQAGQIVDKIERDSYANSKYNWMTVLHFPAECTTDQAKLYTDVTRSYSIASDERDGRGKIVYYPTMCEWNRSFIQGTTGYLWNAFGAERNGSSGTAMGFYNNAAAKATNTAMSDSYKTSRTQDNYQTATNGYYNESDNAQKASSIFYKTDVTSTAEDESLPYSTSLYNADYRGWHQFVLAAYGYSDDYVYDFNDFSDNNWWTICEPFHMTAKEMKAAFGENVDLRMLMSVTRNIGNKTITLNFDSNRLASANDADIVLKAGVPYMIKPAKDDRSNPDNMVLTFEKNAANDARFAPKSADELIRLLQEGEYTVPAIITNNTGEFKEPTVEKVVFGKTVDVHKNLTYTMVGTFFKYYFPLYCYFLGWDNKNSCVTFYWNNKLDKANRTWNPFTAVIVPRWNNSEGFYKPQGEFETIHYNYNSNDVVGTTDDLGGINVEDRETPDPSWYGVVVGAKKVGYSLDFNFNAEDNNSSTAIKDVVNTTTSGNDKIYNLNGQLMNNSLSKGIYVSKGKKFIAK